VYQLTITTTRLAPLRVEVHKVRGAHYRSAIPPETTTRPLRLDRVDRSILGDLARAEQRRLPFDPATLREEWTERPGYLRIRRAWLDTASGDRCVVEVIAERRAIPVARSSRPVREREVGPVAYHDTTGRLEHRLVPRKGEFICSCGDRFPLNRTPTSHHRQLQLAGFPSRTFADLIPAR
jgi:hypothetical protein